MGHILAIALIGMSVGGTPAPATSVTADRWKKLTSEKKVAYVQALADGMFVELWGQMSLDGDAASRPGTESARMRAYLVEHAKEMAGELDRRIAADTKAGTKPVRQYVLSAYFALQPEAKQHYEQMAKAHAKMIDQASRVNPGAAP